MFLRKESVTRTKRDRCGTGQGFNNKCSDPHDLHKYLVVQIAETIRANRWRREKYWQSELFGIIHV